MDTTFNENDIRPAESMRGRGSAFLADIRSLLKFRKDFVDVPCPACGSEKFAKKFEKYELDYLACLECETIYISPRPSSEILEKFYRESELYAYWNKYIFPASEEARRQKIFVPRVDGVLDLCDKYNVAADSLLEVGAGYGTFCHEMMTRGRFKRIVAVEATPDLAQTCRDKGIETIEKPFEAVSFDNQKFDVIACFEVIEHLFSPKQFSAFCRDLLNVNGLLVITCPNAKGFDFITLESMCGNYDHEHLNYFNPGSISRMLKECGFTVLDINTPGKLDAELVRNKILSGEFDVSGQPFLKQVLIEQWQSVGSKFQEFLSMNMLSSSMWVAATRHA